MKKFFGKVSAKIKRLGFWFSVLQYVLLGVKQFFGYLGRVLLTAATGVVGIVAQVFMVLKMIKETKVRGWRKFFAILFLVLGCVSLATVVVLFVGSGGSFLGMDLHAAEYITRACFAASMCFAGADIISIALGTYPGLFLHKVLVNRGSGLPIMDSQTDDPTGRTWGARIFGIEIKVPRLNQKARLTIGVVTLLLGILWSSFDGKEKEQIKTPPETHPGRIFYEQSAPRADVNDILMKTFGEGLLPVVV